MKTTKVICPVCRSEILIPEHSTLVTGMTIAKDSNLGTIELPVSKAQRTINMMSKAGMDTSKYMALELGESRESFIAERGDDGIVRPVVVDDPIAEKMMTDGPVKNQDLFRRWILKQIIDMEFRKDKRSGRVVGVHNTLKSKGYDYMLKMMEEEFRVQARMWATNHPDLDNRNMWFNRDVAVAVAEDFLEHMEHECSTKDGLYCRSARKYYINIYGMNVFVEDVFDKLIEPVKKNIVRLMSADTPLKLYTAFSRFRTIDVHTNGHDYHRTIKLNGVYNPTPRFVRAYKGAGGYYAAINLCVFHGYNAFDEYGHKLSRRASIEYIDNIAKNYAKYDEGYNMLGFFKDMANRNNIDFEAMVSVWREKKLAAKNK